MTASWLQQVEAWHDFYVLVVAAVMTIPALAAPAGVRRNIPRIPDLARRP